jgi:hypothetical protein
MVDLEQVRNWLIALVIVVAFLGILVFGILASIDYRLAQIFRKLDKRAPGSLEER